LDLKAALFEITPELKSSPGKVGASIWARSFGEGEDGFVSGEEGGSLRLESDDD